MQTSPLYTNKRWRIIFLISGLLLILLTSPLFASTEYKATAAFENINFILNRDNHSINDQETFEGDFEFIYDNEKNLKLDLHPRIRFDFMDYSRNRYIPNESYLMYYSDHVELSGGLKLTSWGVSNSFNPTDVINRRDLEDNFYDPEKMGELMGTAKFIVTEAGPFDELTFEILILPLFQKTPLPELDTRFAIQNTALGIPYNVFDLQQMPDYENAFGATLTIAATIKAVDMSLHYYHGPNRNPGYFLMVDRLGALRLRPFYYTIDMIGFNIEAAVSDFVLHLESAYNITALNAPQNHEIRYEEGNAVPKSYAQFVPGFDYTFHNFAGSGDFTVFFEYLLEADRTTNLRNFRPFQNDLFFGFRYDFLNTLGSQIEFGIIKDLSNKEHMILAEISSKIYKELKLSVGGIFVRRDGAILTPLSFFDNNSQVRARLSYSFGGDFK